MLAAALAAVFGSMWLDRRGRRALAELDDRSRRQAEAARAKGLRMSGCANAR